MSSLYELNEWLWALSSLYTYGSLFIFLRGIFPLSIVNVFLSFFLCTKQDHSNIDLTSTKLTIDAWWCIAYHHSYPRTLYIPPSLLLFKPKRHIAALQPLESKQPSKRLLALTSPDLPPTNKQCSSRTSLSTSSLSAIRHVGFLRRRSAQRRIRRRRVTN